MVLHLQPAGGWRHAVAGTASAAERLTGRALGEVDTKARRQLRGHALGQIGHHWRHLYWQQAHCESFEAVIHAEVLIQGRWPTQHSSTSSGGNKQNCIKPTLETEGMETHAGHAAGADHNACVQGAKLLGQIGEATTAAAAAAAARAAKSRAQVLPDCASCLRGASA